VAFLFGLLGLLGGNPLLVFIALFVYLAAAAEAHAAQMRQVSRGMIVSDAMITKFESLSPDSRVEDAVQCLIRTTHAYLLTTIPGETVAPFMNAYLLIMGAWILWKAFRQRPSVSDPPRLLMPLGFGGGFLDAIGGGGSGPMVTSTLLGQGTTPRFTIGSVNLTEFFVTATISATFLGTIGLQLWPIIAGLILGGALAAPVAAYAAYKIPDQPLMTLVGSVIMLLSIRGLIQTAS
jgi:hypothetical protein